MLRTLVISAFGAAVIACLAVSALQAVTTGPMILHAEQFEVAEPDGAAEAGTTAAQAAGQVETGSDHDHAGHDHNGEAWAPADGLERTLFTASANLITGLAVALVLLGLMVLRGSAIDARAGLLWGAAGFAAASLLPALGLPPELPGTPAAGLEARQLWWLATAAASAAGLGLIAFSRQWLAKALGIALLVAPHVLGAPAPPTHDVPYPGSLAGEFVAASLVVSAVLWCVAGAAAGWLYRRLALPA